MQGATEEGQAGRAGRAGFAAVTLVVKDRHFLPEGAAAHNLAAIWHRSVHLTRSPHVTSPNLQRCNGAAGPLPAVPLRDCNLFPKPPSPGFQRDIARAREAGDNERPAGPAGLSWMGGWRLQAVEQWEVAQPEALMKEASSSGLARDAAAIAPIMK